jgi:immunity protein 8 of polymorphic toxin system
VRARLKSLRSDEVPDLARWRPPDPRSFAVPLVLEVGPLGLRGRERFDLLAATPAWLLERHARDGAVLGRGLLVVFEWSYERVRGFLARRVEACSGRTWPDLVRKVGRIAEWEGDEENVVALE